MGALSRHKQKIRQVYARAQDARGRQFGNNARHDEITTSFSLDLYGVVLEKEVARERSEDAFHIPAFVRPEDMATVRQMDRSGWPLGFDGVVTMFRGSTRVAEPANR
jgi:hypothetical protein